LFLFVLLKIIYPVKQADKKEACQEKSYSQGKTAFPRRRLFQKNIAPINAPPSTVLRFSTMHNILAAAAVL